MKRILISTIYSLLFVSLFSQLSEGGKPKSLSLQLDKNVPTYTLAPLDMEKVSAEDKANENLGKMERIGIVRPVNLTFNNSGVWTTLDNGDRIWRLVIYAQEAKAINLYFEDFKLPNDASLFVYNPHYSQIIGAFTAKNNHESGQFSTAVIYGDKLVIEYYEPLNQRGKSNFVIAEISHQYKQTPFNDVYENAVGVSGDCEVNVNCSEGNSWQDEKKGVARIEVKIGNNAYLCSGTLVNNTALDCTPYFLTAYHCSDGASTSDFNNWIFYFDYESNGCSDPASEPNTNTITGCSVIASSNDGGSSSSDLLLLELNSNVPQNYDVYYNGWNRLNTPSSSGVGIHHPAGDIKKISTYTQQLTTSGYNSSLSTHWKVYWTATTNGHGVTEGGSSGSPLFNDQGLVIGSLTGGGSSCSATYLSDLYGKMAYHWNSNGTANNKRVDIWLDPVGNGSATSLNGTYSPCSPSLTMDAGISIINNPSAEICGNTFIPEVVLRNYGSSNLTSCQIRFGLASGATQTYYWTGNLATNGTATVTLPQVTATTTGNTTFTAFTELPNGNIDQNTANDSKSISVVIGASVALPLYQSFQATTFPPIDYGISNGDNDETWQRTNNYGSGSTASMFIDNWDYDGNGAYDWFILPTVNFTGVTNATLSYDYAYAYYDGQAGTFYDSLIIAYSTDCGNSWYALDRRGGVDLATVGGLSQEFGPTSAEWDNSVIDLNIPDLNNQSGVQFAFVAVNGYGNNLYIDNINIELGSPVNVGIKEESTWINDIVVYPNPTNNLINLELSLGQKEDLDIQIFNTLGKVIEQRSLLDFESGVETFDVNKQASGIYFIRISNNTDSQTIRFIKK